MFSLLLYKLLMPCIDKYVQRKRYVETERVVSLDRCIMIDSLLSDTLMAATDRAESLLLFTREILTLAMLNLHYKGVHWTCPWLRVLMLCQLCLLPGVCRVGAWAWSRNSCPQWKWIMGLGACRARTGLAWFSPSCHRSAHNDSR